MGWFPASPYLLCRIIRWAIALYVAMVLALVAVTVVVVAVGSVILVFTWAARAIGF